MEQLDDSTLLTGGTAAPQAGESGALSHESASFGADFAISGTRPRGTRFMRWRPDKAPQQCTMDQVEKNRAHPFVRFREGARSQ